MLGRLAGKVAVVSGAASGLGSATARLFAAEGAHVVALDINEAALDDLDLTGGEHVRRQCDVSVGVDVREAVSLAMSALGRIDVLFNCAGIVMRSPGPWDASQDGPVADLAEDVFDRSLAVNLKSQYLMCKAVLPHMVGAGAGGSIVNVSSIGGGVMGTSNAAYCMAKAGVIGLTRSLAFTYGKDGIRANAICPGAIRTPIVDYMIKDDEYRTAYETAHPLGRFGEPAEMASIALFLASDDSSYVNGSVITADGGWTIRAR